MWTTYYSTVCGGPHPLVLLVPVSRPQLPVTLGKLWSCALKCRIPSYETLRTHTVPGKLSLDGPLLCTTHLSRKIFRNEVQEQTASGNIISVHASKRLLRANGNTPLSRLFKHPDKWLSQYDVRFCYGNKQPKQAHHNFNRCYESWLQDCSSLRLRGAQMLD